MTLQRSRLEDDDRAASEEILTHMLAKLPDWYAAMASQDIMAYRAILASARKLKRAKRNITWNISVVGMSRDFEKLRAAVLKRAGSQGVTKSVAP